MITKCLMQRMRGTGCPIVVVYRCADVCILLSSAV